MARNSKTQAKLRRKVAARDGGKCFYCGLDTEKEIERAIRLGLQPSFLISVATATDDKIKRFNAIAYLREKWGVSTRHRQPLHTLWEMDHRVPLGINGKNTLENCVTACVICHKLKTQDDHGMIAKARRCFKKEGPKARQLRETRERLCKKHRH